MMLENEIQTLSGDSPQPEGPMADKEVGTHGGELPTADDQ